MFKKSLKGGALYLSVFIGMLIAVLLSALVLYSYYCNIDFLRFTVRQSVHANLYSGFNYASSDACEMTVSPRKIDLYDKNTDSIEYTKKWWGCYQVIGVRSFRKGISESMLCLTGTTFVRDTALVLTENNKPLAVAGKTELKGLCLIPKAGTRPAHIEGETFWGDKVIEGLQMEAPQQLPGLNPVIYKQVEELGHEATEDSLVTLDQLPDADTIKNSFLSKTVRVIAPGTILLDNVGLSGNIIVQSPKRIIVNKSSILENVLLSAPIIEIREGFSGTLQALAIDSIILENEVSLSYPSSLLLINKPMLDTAHKNISVPALILGEKCIVKGTLAACVKEGNFTNKIYLKVGKDSQVQGMVYSGGYLDLQGTITGTAFAKGFILNTRSGVYEQHLLNAVIDRRALSDFFVAGVLLNGKSPNKIVKWVN